MPYNNAKKNIRPLIKWTGGKYEEYPKFARYIPTFDRYFEPFFGGGGVFFALQHGGTSFINDRSEDLIAFYRAISDDSFRLEIYNLVEAWEAIRPLNDDFSNIVAGEFKQLLAGKCEIDRIVRKTDNYFSTTSTKKLLQDFSVFTPIDITQLKKHLKNAAKDKFARIKHIAKREQRIFNRKEVANHIETALRSGFYTYIRYLINNATSLDLKDTSRTAAWYFVRELCYASMFRYNAKGEFNIPYGGIAYNRKRLRAKVDTLFSLEVKELLHRSRLYNLDFEDFLNEVKPQKADFIFLDPPYDSEFSEYDQNPFNQTDQIRLRDCLHQQSAAWMLVIKETPFIRKIYEQIGAHFIDYQKTYQYNMRGRNMRNTKHLIITNYAPDTQLDR